MKPRLTDKVLRGLATACANGLAGDVADLTGGTPDRPTAEEQRTWDEVEAAEAWVRAMQKERATRRAERK